MCQQIDCNEETFKLIKNIFETYDELPFSLIDIRYPYEIRGLDGDRATENMVTDFVDFLKEVTSKIVFNGELETYIQGKIFIDYPEYYSASDITVIAIDMNKIEVLNSDDLSSICSLKEKVDELEEFFSDGEKTGYVLAQCKYCENDEFMSWNDSRDGILPAGYKRCEYCAYDICGECTNEKYLHKPNNGETNIEHFCIDCWKENFEYEEE